MTATSNYQRMDAAHYLHPFTDHKELHARGSRVIVRGNGVYLWDSDGHKILDGMSGLWCVNVGYGRDEIVNAAAAQMRELPYYNSFFQCATPPAIALAEKLSDLAPQGFGHVFFTGSGSEANDTVIRLVRRYWDIQGEPQRTVIISRHNAYHGSTIGGASLGGMAFMHSQGGLPIPDIAHIRQPYLFEEKGGGSADEFGLIAARALEEKIEEVGANRVAAFIGEPVQGAGGVIIPPRTYWPEIQRICDKYSILLISDEVICAFGRLGRWFGCEYFGARPHLMTIAKALTSGYLPMGGVMVREEIADALINKCGEFAHGFTYSGHPACAAAALANLKIIEEENLIDRARNEIGTYLQKQFAELQSHPLVGEARMLGMVGALELVSDKETRARFEPQGRAGSLCRDFCIECGLVMRAVRDTMIVAPPLTLRESEADELIGKVRRALDLTAHKLSE